MKTQQDSKYRVVALENLRAMCKHMSGVAHTYQVTRVSRSRVHVEYSNPDEYGSPHPMTAVFPCYPSAWADDQCKGAAGTNANPRVVLDYLRIIGDEDGEGWQSFEVLRDCPTLYRDIEVLDVTKSDGRLYQPRWRTHLQIRKDGDERCPKGRTLKDHEDLGWTCDEQCVSETPCGCIECDLETYKCKRCGSKWTPRNPTSFSESVNGNLCKRCQDATPKKEQYHEGLIDGFLAGKKGVR